MVDVINVAVGAMLGVILADSPQFKMNSLTDLYAFSIFILLIIMFACNIWVTTLSMTLHRHNVTTVSIFAYFVMEACLFLSYTFDSSILPPGQEGIVLKFTGAP
jgi:hypothetical protein